MLNSVREASRVRMTPEERRRQLVGIGLRKFVESPVQDLSLDEVAAEAGVSRGLLFHYFPSKTDYHRAVVEAAWRRVGRNVTPDEDAVGPVAVRQVVERFLLQVERRRDTYVALVLGQAPIARAAGVVGPAEVGAATVAGGSGADATPQARGSGVDGLRGQLATLVTQVADLPDAALPAAHGWVAYLEDRALQWSALPEDQREAERQGLVEHCTQALALLTR
jgi:AcrR family transcriptional regulator